MGIIIRGFVLLFLLSAQVFGQGVVQSASQNVWYAGRTGMFIDFNGGAPVINCASTLTASEGSGMFCDPNTGSLLLYTNGAEVKNAAHNTVANGTNLNGNSTSTETALVLPKSCGNLDEFFIFSNNTSEVYWSEVDLSVGPNGTLDPTTKNTLLQANTGERLGCAPYGLGNGGWILLTDAGGVLNSYFVSSTGINTTPVQNFTGLFNTTGSERGCITINEQLDQLVIGIEYQGVYICDFDINTGLASNFMQIPGTTDGFSACFSPDGSKVYYTNGWADRLDQYDIATGTVTNLHNNQSGVKLGPDGVVYVVTNSQTALGTITNPNAVGLACNYTVAGLPIPGGCTTGWNLPNQSIDIASNGSVTFVPTVQDALCNGVNNGSIALTANGGTPPYQYSIDGGLTFQNSFAFLNLSAGSYQIEVRDVNNSTNCNNSSAASTINIEFQSSVYGNSSSKDLTCFNATDGEITINPTGGVSPYTYSIDNGATFSNNSTFSNLSDGTYPIQIIDAQGCIAQSIEIINNPPDLVFDITPDNCYDVGENITLVANASGGSGTYSYEWKGMVNSNIANITAAIDTFYTAEVEDINGCTKQKSTKIKIKPSAEFSAPIRDHCLPANVEFINQTSSASGQATVYWNFNDASIIKEDSSSIVMHEYTAPGTYDVAVSIMDINGCSVTDTAKNYIQILPPVEASFYFDGREITTTKNNVRFFNSSFGADKYTWLLDKNEVDSTYDYRYSFPQEQGDNYEICLHALSTLTGCADTICQTVEVLDKSSVYIPNAFTPNGDGINDEFGPIGKGFSDKDYSFQIFNRWGDQLFATKQLNQFWDGSHNGEMVQNGLYSYKLILRLDENFKIEHYTGQVYLMK